MVDIETIDRLYGFRFFVLVKNSYVHRKVFDHQSLWIDLKILWKNPTCEIASPKSLIQAAGI
jgi:hypothetical protein